MAGVNFQRLKLLKLMEILRQESDEEHPITTSRICEKLAKADISCDRRTLYNDIDFLNSQGFEVMKTKVKHENAYYVEERGFDISEIKILMDAVQAASFITEKKTNELVDKIASLGGSHRAELLKENIVCFNSRKHSNESIYYNVSCLEKAIRNKKKVAFRYFDINEKGDRVYRKNKEKYITEPMALIYNEDNYYLMSFNAKYDGVSTYRLDRMDSTDMLDEDVSDNAVIYADDTTHFTEQAFKMFGGPVEDVVLQFSKDMIGVIYDKFGEKTAMIKSGENYIANVKVQVSPVFWGWVCQFPRRLKILSPEVLKKDFEEWIEKLKG